MTDPRDVHRVDQLLAGTSELALYVSRHFSELQAHGLTREEALALTIEYQRAMYQGAITDKETD